MLFEITFWIWSFCLTYKLKTFTTKLIFFFKLFIKNYKLKTQKNVYNSKLNHHKSKSIITLSIKVYLSKLTLTMIQINNDNKIIHKPKAPQGMSRHYNTMLVGSIHHDAQHFSFSTHLYVSYRLWIKSETIISIVLSHGLYYKNNRNIFFLSYFSKYSDLVIIKS